MQIGSIEAGRLVYFHDHGNPGPGLYLPDSWASNRAHFSSNGITAPLDLDARALQPLPAEGFYRVTAAFYCCDKQCVKFEPDAFVQLGYNGNGKPLVFIPELGNGSITVPTRGVAIDDTALVNLVAVKIAERKTDDIDISLPRGIVVH